MVMLLCILVIWAQENLFFFLSYFFCQLFFKFAPNMQHFNVNQPKPNTSAGKRGWQVVKYLWCWGPCCWGLTNTAFWRLLCAADINICDNFTAKTQPDICVSLHRFILIRVQKPLKQHLHHHASHSAVSAASMCCTQQGAALLQSYLQPTNLPCSTGCCYSPTVISSCNQLERVVTDDRGYGWFI